MRTIALLIIATCILGCTGDPVPRPRGWFRIDLPEKGYTAWAPECPFSAEIPTYAHVVATSPEDQSCWFNLRFPGQRAVVHLTYKPVRERLGQLITDAHDFKNKHELKASRISSERVVRDSARVFGTLFDVDGDVASPMVFYLTDSTTHFLYGALYFNARPNADSLAPVTARIRDDIRHFAGSLRWEDSGGALSGPPH